MSPDANRPTPGPAFWTYMPGVAKKLWLFPTLAFVLAVIGDVLDYNSNWNFVTVLVSFPVLFQLGRLLATKKLPDNSHLANGNRLFLFMSILQAALMTASFLTGGYLYAILLFTLTVAFASLYLWGADVNLRAQARKSAGES